MANKTMKIGEALALLKSKKSRIAELQRQRKDSFNVKEGNTPTFSFDELTNEIERESRNLLKIKYAIITANNTIMLTKDMSLQQCILEIGELRSSLANLSDLMKKDDEDRYSYSTPIKRTPQKPLQDIDKKIQEIAHTKAIFDSNIQNANWQNTIEIDLI
jgi:hypothetical protein